MVLLTITSANFLAQSPRKSPTKSAPSRGEQVAVAKAFGPSVSPQTRQGDKRKRSADQEEGPPKDAGSSTKRNKDHTFRIDSLDVHHRLQ
ncbi:hypothetical protein BDN70DRAFT_878553 [Pholiota conissans]|uniref:Uncharacterized protein n=1 Tax=Pholiota conissans TaxID=109636 RepID=A0A9P5Z416_9AGAR|nr:hypothetical protein BDN70DRAFT_878553 [Pholiota conissans]